MGAILLAGVLASGCGAQSMILGTEGSSVLTGMDALGNSFFDPWIAVLGDSAARRERTGWQGPEADAAELPEDFAPEQAALAVPGNNIDLN